jgi:TRAP-type C4-dicarboxylate transport system permease small subunit
MSDQTMSTAPAIGARRVILVASAGLLAFERLALMGLMYLLTALILVNVVTRYSHFPIYWIDESAVYSVVWLTFIGASAMTRLRLDFAVTMMTERLSARSQQIFKIIATSTVIVFGIGLIVTCMLWMDPIGLAQAGFDAKKFAGQTFNFLYTERTQTLNWPTWVLYLTLPILRCRSPSMASPICSRISASSPRCRRKASSSPNSTG